MENIKELMETLEKIASGAYIDLTPQQAQDIIDYIKGINDTLKEVLDKLY